MSLELAIKSRKVIEAAFKRNGDDGQIRLAQTLLCVLDGQPADMGQPRFTRHFKEQLRERASGQRHSMCGSVDGSLLEETMGQRRNVLLHRPRIQRILLRLFRRGLWLVLNHQLQ